MNMNIQKLPVEMIYQIVTSMDSCSDILNFCITNSENKSICKENSHYLIKKAIERKYPGFRVTEFTKQISEDFDKALRNSSEFSYLNGTGIYQKDFDAMPDTFISATNRYRWTAIKTSLLFISQALKDKRTITMTGQLLPFMDSFGDFKFNSEARPFLEIFRTRRFGDFQSLYFDSFIDIFVRLNKESWAPIYEKYAVTTGPFCFNFTGSVDPPSGDKQKYILTILCKILNRKKRGDFSEQHEIFDKFFGLGYADTIKEVCDHLLKKIGLSVEMLHEYIDLQRQTPELSQEEIVKRMICKLNDININLNPVLCSEDLLFDLEDGTEDGSEDGSESENGSEDESEDN